MCRECGVTQQIERNLAQTHLNSDLQEATRSTGCCRDTTTAGRLWSWADTIQAASSPISPDTGMAIADAEYSQIAAYLSEHLAGPVYGGSRGEDRVVYWPKVDT